MGTKCVKTMKLFVYLDRCVVEMNKLGQLRNNHTVEISNFSTYQPTLLAVAACSCVQGSCTAVRPVRFH